jgi:FkbM family methyltransferase
MRVDQNIYDLALHHIGSTKTSAFVVIIGAMDGVSFDETRGYISKYNWDGLFVEPIPEQFNRLKTVYKNKPNSICENVAISDYNGEIQMLKIKQEVIDSGLVHPCFGGMSAVYPPKNGLASEGDRETVEKYGEKVTVKCITPDALFDKHKIAEFDIISIDTEGHDYTILKNIDLAKYRPKVVRIEYINLDSEQQNKAIEYLENNNYVYNIIGQNLDAVQKDYWAEMQNSTQNTTVAQQDESSEKPNITIVTGIWDLGRDALAEGWSRNFEHYVQKFEELLQNLTDIPLIVFIDPQHENIVWKYRSRSNTAVYHQTKEQFNSAFFPFFDDIQKIRNNPDWYNQTGWLKDSTQAKMEWYNPMVMAKMFMLHNAKCFNPFNTEYFFWLDGGITNTVHPGYFSHDKVLSKIPNIVDKFFFICFPYETTTEIHGFQLDKMKQYSNSSTVNRVARGGFFGGHADYISRANAQYYDLLQDSLRSGYMGTEESIFTIMTYLDPDTYKYESIDDNGLISTFFEKLKTNNITLTTTKSQRKKHSNNQVMLYINAFNSPEQLQMVLKSFEKYDKNFINKTTKVLINNSTKTELFETYDKICEEYNFVEHIKKGNLGICRARQLCAEHFAKSGAKYMMFFEDDMLLDFNGNCNFGFNKNIPNLFDSIIKIMDHESYDFLKFSFSEFYGHNGDQWSWHNVPETKRIEYFGKINKKPPTKIYCIKSYNGVPYAEGEIYYCNWPQILDQEGNQKLFLDTTWANPFEQTWMSHIYTLTREQKVRTAILLASPITHNRVHFYKADERREN